MKKLVCRNNSISMNPENFFYILEARAPSDVGFSLAIEV